MAKFASIAPARWTRAPARVRSYRGVSYAPWQLRWSGEGLGDRSGAKQSCVKSTAAWRMGEPRRPFISGLYGTVGRLHTPVREPAVAYRLQECCGDKSYALTECSSNHTAKAAVSV